MREWTIELGERISYVSHLHPSVEGGIDFVCGYFVRILSKLCLYLLLACVARRMAEGLGEAGSGGDGSYELHFRNKSSSGSWDIRLSETVIKSVLGTHVVNVKMFLCGCCYLDACVVSLL